MGYIDREIKDFLIRNFYNDDLIFAPVILVA